MAIDTSLYGRQPQTNPLASILQTVSTIRGFDAQDKQNRLADLVYGQKEKEIADEAKLSGVYKNSLKPDGTVDRNLLYTGAADAGLGAKLPAIQKGFLEQDKAAAEARKAHIENATKINGMVGAAAGAVLQNPTYENAVAVHARLKSMLPPDLAAQLDKDAPPQDPAQLKVWAQTHYTSAIDANKQLADARARFEGDANRGNALNIANIGAATTRRGQDMTQETTVRGQDLVDARAKDATESGKVPAGYRRGADGNLEAIPGGPAAAKSTEQQKAASDANSVLGLLDMAEPLLKQATNSYAGTGVDKVAQAFGVSTEGAQASAQLKALEGSLVSKMPKMSGPQSDKDVLLYRQMAGQIGDSTLPAETRMAAVKVIRQLNQKYVADNGGTPQARVADAVKNGEVTKLANARPVSVKSAADYAKLPSGTVYMAPDGSMRTKQ